MAAFSLLPLLAKDGQIVAGVALPAFWVAVAALLAPCTSIRGDLARLARWAWRIVAVLFGYLGYLKSALATRPRRGHALTRLTWALLKPEGLRGAMIAAASVGIAVLLLVGRFDIESYSDFSAK